MTSDHLTPDAGLAAALDDIARLHATCCEPGRSPRMERLTATVAAARDAMSTDRPGAAMDLLADAGAQVGWLQVACCAASRLPRYTAILGALTAAHLSLQGHDH